MTDLVTGLMTDLLVWRKQLVQLLLLDLLLQARRTAQEGLDLEQLYWPCNQHLYTHQLFQLTLPKAVSD